MRHTRRKSKIMHPRDLARLRGKALPSTHLARYDAANDSGAETVLDLPCVECGAVIGVQCLTDVTTERN